MILKNQRRSDQVQGHIRHIKDDSNNEHQTEKIKRVANRSAKKITIAFFQAVIKFERLFTSLNSHLKCC